MDFYDVLDQVVNLLKQRERMTYRAIKRQFSVDDEFIADLKEELIYSPQPVEDDNGRGFIWTGATETIRVTTSPNDQSEPQPVAEPAEPIQVTSRPIEPKTPGAERRQLTVMFVDLVGSTELSGRFDPEDLREIVREYQRSCTEVIAKYDGNVAQLLGDGLLVYFGYPQAHEDNAQRAVHTGLGIIDAIETLNTRLEPNKGVKLAVRIGIHTGLVVVVEMGGEGRHEQLALGETPNVAARIQGLAEPDTLIVSDDTHRLVEGYFDVESLGEHDLKGVAQPIAIHRIVSDRGIQNRLDVASVRGLTSLVGRESESTLLFERWTQAKEGQGQVVLLSGEAGIGKSRLTQALKDHVADDPHIRWECRSSPYFTNSALYPVIDLIQRTLGWQQDNTADDRLVKLEHNRRQYHLPLAETVPLFATLLSLPVPEGRYPSLALSPQRQREKTLEALVAIILELAEPQPVLFIVEDLHWTDPTTLALINLLIDQTPTASIYALLTCRPEFQSQWANRSYFTQITLNRLSRDGIQQMVGRVTGEKPLPAEVIQQLVDKTDGVPLYVEEMTKSILESGVLKESSGHYELSGPISSLAIPATLQDSLMARLDRLMTAKVIAQLGATIGRQFDYGLLQAVSGLDEPTLQRELGKLVDAELLYQRGLPPHATYIFKHALVNDIAYESLLRSTRQGYHGRIAEVLAQRFPETVESQPELLAYHFVGAGLSEEAVRYWQRAGEKAIQRSAYVEAIAHLQEGLALLKVLPDTPERTKQEVVLLTTLGSALMATKGHAAPEVESIYDRARALCRQVEDSPQLCTVLMGLRLFYMTRGELQAACEVGEQLLQVAQRQHDTSMLVEAHRGQGHNMLTLGALPKALSHLKQGMALYDPYQHRSHAFLYGQDPAISCHGMFAFTLWLLGCPEQALQKSKEAQALAQDLAHPYSLAFALIGVTTLSLFRREVAKTQKQSEKAMAYCAAQGFSQYLANATILYGWALSMQEQAERGIDRIREGFNAFRDMQAKFLQPYFLALFAEAYATVGQSEAGLACLADALTVVDITDERWYESELHRLKGELVLQQSSDNAVEAETCFHQAISIAQSQSAKSWELRAATSLARLWQSQGKVAEARDLLAPVYTWFQEGHDTADLIDAKALLDALLEDVS